MTDTPAPASAPSAPAAPAAAPSAPPVSPSPTSAPSSPAGADPFANLGSADDLDATIEIPSQTAATPPAGEAPAAPAEAPLVPTPEPPKPPTPAAQPPQEQPAAQPAATPAPAQADLTSPQGLVQQLAVHRDAVLDGLAADRFKLSPEEIKAVDTDAVAAIPRIMARTYYEAMQSTLLHINNMVPQMVLNTIRAQRASDQIEDAFYGQFKALDRLKHGGDVQTFAKMMRATNPKITQQDLFAMVGAAVMGKYGLQNVPAAPGGNGATPRTPQPPPFVPAPPGASVKVIPEPESPWAGLGKDFDE